MKIHTSSSLKTLRQAGKVSCLILVGCILAEKSVDFGWAENTSLCHSDLMSGTTDKMIYLLTECIDRENADSTKKEDSKAELYFRRASVYNNAKKYSEALDDVGVAIKLNPKRGGFYALHAYILTGLKKYEEALEVIKAAVTIQRYDNREYSELYNVQGVALKNLERLSEAIESYSQAIRFNPAAHIHRNRAISYKKQGKNRPVSDSKKADEDYKLALQDLNEADKMKSYDFETLKYRGQIYLFLKDYPKSIADFSNAININPNDCSLYADRGYAYGKVGQEELAIKDKTKSLEVLNPGKKISVGMDGNVTINEKVGMGGYQIRLCLDPGASFSMK
ncbi:MAG: tetratricopeptide repeat protein [Magnetococcales bacterium]|nr:tetratricopeptide repeat protein [Magnetococcales bacterium]